MKVATLVGVLLVWSPSGSLRAGAPHAEHLEAADAPVRGKPSVPRLPPVRRSSEGDRLADLRESAREFLLGLSAQDHGDLAGAEEAYRRAIELDPAFVEARVNLARVLMTSGRADEARQHLDQALAIRSDYPKTYAARGVLALLRGDVAGARTELERALRLDPDDVEVRVNLASLLLQQRALRSARAHLERALELDSQHAAAVLNRALVEDLSRRSVEAAYYYGYFLDLAAPDDPDRQRVERRLRHIVVSERKRSGAPDVDRARAEVEGPQARSGRSRWSGGMLLREKPAD